MFTKSETFKRILSASAAAVCMISALRLVPFDGTSVSADDTMTAFEITENMEIGWNIGNSLDSTGTSETSWGNPVVTQELINAVKAKGFNTIRVPITWYMHLDSDNNIDQAWLARVKEVVDYAYSQDMYVIINIHHEDWINRSDFSTAYNEMSPKLIKIWQQIGTYFSDYGQRLIFEGMNEPRETGSTIEWSGNEACYDVVNKLNHDFVNTIRSIDSPYKDTRLLMVPSYCASGYDYVYSYMDVPDDDFVAVSLHAYAPYDFAMNPNVAQSAHDTFTDAYRSQLNSLFNNMCAYFTDKDIPVVLGEFSASNYNNTEARCEWADCYITAAKKVGIPCILWDNDAYQNEDPAEDHAYINRDTLQWYPESEPVVDAMMSVINNSDIIWGSNRKLPTYKHADISTGTSITASTSGISIDASVTGGNCTPGYNITGADLVGKDIAVKFTGSTPILAFTNADWDGWTEISPYTIDNNTGIAYYSYDSIKAAWGDTSTIAHIFARTGGTTVIYNIAVIDASEIVEPTTEPTTVPTTEPTTEPTTVPTTEPTTEPTTVPTTEPTTEPTTGDSFIYGDANSDDLVTVADSILILQYISDGKTYPMTDEQINAADVYLRGDGLNAQDALSIQKFKANQISVLPESIMN